MKIVCSWPFTQRHTRGRPGATDCGMAYMQGLRQLGHEVYLFEEVEPAFCWDERYQPVSFAAWSGCQHFERVTRAYGIWPNCALIYDGGRATYGLSFSEAAEVASNAQLILSIGTSLRTPALVEAAKVRAYVDEAPGKSQVYQFEYGIDQGFENQDHVFTVGLNVATKASEIPTGGLEWIGIVHPVDLSAWPEQIDPRREKFTTVTNWSAKETFELEGTYSGEKSENWLDFISLPAKTDQPLEVSINMRPGYEADISMFTEHGWWARNAQDLRSLEDYRAYIAGSRAEFSVANNRYVRFNTGWTSDRTARYLASGKPAVVQSTGIEAHLPTGEGLLTFASLDEALECIESVNRDYMMHCRAARRLAETEFDARIVLSRMLDRMGLNS